MISVCYIPCIPSEKLQEAVWTGCKNYFPVSLIIALVDQLGP